MHFNVKNLTGERFFKLVVKSYVGGGKWLCECDCGSEKIASTGNLKKGHIKSCGCFRKERAATLRPTFETGEYGSTEYLAWRNMMIRCYKKHLYEKNWHNYGGRGIKVCDRWHSFQNFFLDMGTKPSPDLTLERIDTDKDYCPENCKWATMKEQQNNRRNSRK